MSLRIKHLNADTSFLLIFTPPLESAHADRQGTFPGSYTILVDPWLSGASTVFHRRFAHTERRTAACVESLRDLPEPDVILISQDKSDHCHRETLCTLDPASNILILAPPSAAKKIKSWKHFDPCNVRALARYDECSSGSVYRVPIPAFSSLGQPGEVTISLMAPKVDMTGLHQAIGVTYRPPSSPLSTTRQVPLMELPLPSPPVTPPDLCYETRSSSSSFFSRQSYGRSATRRRQESHGSTELSRPDTPVFRVGGAPSLRSSKSMPYISNPVANPWSPREKTMSILYSPHGLSYEMIRPWATRHLVEERALPLTALFHGLEQATNPWYLGGNVLAGAQNGVHVASELSARTWFVAHDEEKESTGFSTKALKCRRFTPEEVRGQLAASVDGRTQPAATELLDLDSGEEYVLRAV